MSIFEVVVCFLIYYLSNQLNFYVVVRIYKIKIFDEAIFFLATVAVITEWKPLHGSKGKPEWKQILS